MPQVGGTGSEGRGQPEMPGRAAPKRRRHWGRDGELPVRLSPAETVAAQRLVKWLVPLRGEERFEEMFRCADLAIAGQPFEMVDYTPPLAAHQAPTPIGGCASAHSREFYKLFPETRYKELHMALANGAEFEWESEERQAVIRAGSPGHDFSPGTPQCLPPEQFEVYRAHQAVLREKKVVRASGPHEIKFYIQTFMLDKFDSNGVKKGTRHIHNSKALNILQKRLRQRLTGVSALALELQPGACQTIMDYSEFFWQYLLQWKECVLLGIAGPINRLTGEKLEDDILLVMNMGGRQCAPLCSRHAQAFVAKLNSCGASAIGYVDEVHQQGSSPGAVWLMTMLAAAATSYLGWQLGWDKFKLWGSRQVEFLGLTWCSRLMRRQVRWGRRRKICLSALALFKAYVEGTLVPIKQKASLQGQMTAAQAGAREFGLMGVHTQKELGQDLRAHRQQYTALVRVRKAFACVCCYLVRASSDKWWGYVRTGAPSRTFTGDASCYGYGVELRGATDPVQALQDTFTPDELKLSHTELEQVCTHKGVGGLAEANGYRGTPGNPFVMLAETDNDAVRAICNKHRSKSVRMANRQLSFMRQVLDPRHMQLRATWIPGTMMVKEREADMLSRILTRWHEWPLHLPLVWQVCTEFMVDRHSLVDMFAEESTARARRFLVWKGDGSNALCRDALSRSLCCEKNSELRSRDVMWAFPPPSMLSTWFTRFREASNPPDMILVVPAVKSKLGRWAPWMKAGPLLLPPAEESLAPPEGEARPANAPAPVYPPFRLTASLTSKRCGGVPGSSRKTGSSRATTGSAGETKANSTTVPLASSSRFAWLRDVSRTSAR